LYGWVTALLLVGGAIFWLTAFAFGPTPSQNTERGDVRTEHFLANITEGLMGKALVLSVAKESFDLSKNLEQWKNRRWFSYVETTTTPLPGRLGLSAIILRHWGLANPWQAFSQTERVWGFDLDTQKIYTYLSEQRAASGLEEGAQSARLVIQENRAVEFVPHRTGLAPDLRLGVATVKTALFSGQTLTDLPLVITQPEIELAQLNDLGINQLVAEGVSDFSGSSKSRIHNIRTGSEKFQGLILKPSEEFSFTTSLGPVTEEAGFLPELVIKTKETVPELGGGLCQVSTTAFRAALYGGLPITARRNHSYAVKYYAPQGTDATIYPGAVDFKFINDTAGHLLIATHIEGNKLYFDFYGTPDDRKVTIDGPYSYDVKPDGSMKTRLTRTVTRGEIATTDTFLSRYVSKDLFPTQYAYPQTPATPASTTEGQNPNPPAAPAPDPTQTPAESTPAPQDPPAPNL
jgi:vancomycin resistance protein YoaR